MWVVGRPAGSVVPVLPPCGIREIITVQRRVEAQRPVNPQSTHATELRLSASMAQMQLKVQATDGGMQLSLACMLGSGNGSQFTTNLKRKQESIESP